MHLNFVLFTVLLITTTPCNPTHLHLQPHQLPPPSSPSILIHETSDSPVSPKTSKGLFDYSGFYNRASPKFRPLVIVLFILWITFLFSFVGIVASDFFCPNLSTISSRLNLSESLAGVTLLGFGNGAPDVFSTFAAFKSNTGSLAIGELIGASLFIVSVVVGTMSIVRPFRVPRHSFLRDLIFFIIAIVFVLIIIVDRGIRPWQANALVLIYLTYVLTVLLSSWSVKKIQSKRDQIRIARSLYSQDDQFLEPYRDDPDFPIQPTPDPNPLIGSMNHEDHDSTNDCLSPQLSPLSPARPLQSRMKSSSTMSSHSDSFKSLLETSYPITIPVGNRRMRAPSISYQSNLPPINLLNSSTSSSSTSPHVIRGNLPRTHSNESPETSMSSPDNLKRRPRRNTIMMNGPIRPSLLGAIEFRDVVNSLTRDSSVHSTIRPTSPNLTHRRLSSSRHPRSDSAVVELVRGNHSDPSIDPAHRIPSVHQPSTSTNHPTTKLDEFSFENGSQSSHASGAMGHRRSSKSADFTNQSQRSGRSPGPKSSDSRSEHQKQINQGEQVTQAELLRSNSNALENDDRKSVGSIHRFRFGSTSQPINRQSISTPPPLLPSILITTDRQEVIRLPDTPLIESTQHHHEHHPPNTRLRVFPEGRWGKEWKEMLRIVWETLFPTLKDWRMKSELGIFLALFSAPAVFVLTLTLPVVVDETEEESVAIEDKLDEQGQLGNLVGANDIKISPDDLNASGLFSSTYRDQNLDHPHEGEHVGLGLGCVLEEEEDLRMNDGEFVTKSPEPEDDQKSIQSSGLILGEQNGEIGTLSHETYDEAQEGLEEEDAEEEEEQEVSSQDVARILAAVQSFLAPPFWVICLLDQDDDSPRVDEHLSNSTTMLYNDDQIGISSSASRVFWLELVASLVAGLILSKLVLETLKNKDTTESFVNDTRSREDNLLKRFKSFVMNKLNWKKVIKIALCLIGFINSMIYILLIVNQLIELLKFFAQLFHISDSILGLTIFGIGNSLGDFVANFTVAKMGFPVMAISACFGGPMLNILLGIGVSARLVISSTKKGSNSLDMMTQVVETEESMIKIQSSTSLFISTIGLLVILIAMLVLIPLKKSFLFDRSVGYSLILSYSLVFFFNLIVEIFF